MRQALREASPGLPDDQREAAADRLAGWVELVAQWNQRIDLTAARSPEELVDLMIADALALSSRVQPGARWVDVGTGAGAPGMGLGLLHPGASFTLVEPLTKRVAFLRTVVGTLTTPAVTVVRGRGEDVAGPFDVAVSRATLAPPDWLALGHRLAPAGDVYVLLARDEPPALAGRAAVDDVSYRWPLTGAPRRLVRYAPIP